MDQLLTLFIGDRACDAGINYYYLEVSSPIKYFQFFQSQQIFSEEDPINHKAIFDIDLTSIKPRALFFGNNQEIQASINNVQLQKIKIDEESKLDQSQPYQKLINEYLDDFHLEKQDYFIMKDNGFETQFENINDILSTKLEKINRCNGFQIVIDTNEYLYMGQRILDLIHDQSNKCPILCVPVHDQQAKPSQTLEELSFIKRMISLFNFSEQAQIVCPFQLPFKNFSFFHQRNDYFQYQQFAFLFSQITLPYRTKNEQTGFESFTQRMTPYASCNIFNLTGKIPNLDDKPEFHILNHKSNLLKEPWFQKNYAERVLQYKEKFHSFSESFSLRGMTAVPDERDLKTIGIDIRILDDIWSVPKLFNDKIFSQQVQDTYLQPDEDSQKEDNETFALPMHTCIFSNECYKYTIKNYQNQMQQINKKIIVQLEKDGITSDDFLELLHKMEIRIEDYGGFDQDDEEEQQDESGDDM